MKRRSFFAIALAPLLLKIRGLKAQSGRANDTDTATSHPPTNDKQKYQLPLDPKDREIDSLGTAIIEWRNYPCAAGRNSKR